MKTPMNYYSWNLKDQTLVGNILTNMYYEFIPEAKKSGDIKFAEDFKREKNV